MFYVYVIRSEKDGRFYVGMCTDLERKLREHNAGKTFSTKGYLPWTLVFAEEYGSRTEGRNREKFLKGGSGKELIKKKWSGSSAEYLPAGRQGATANNYVLRLCDKERKGWKVLCWNVHGFGKEAKRTQRWKDFFDERLSSMDASLC